VQEGAAVPGSHIFANPKEDEYRRETIVDETGTYRYDDDPHEYMKARKRQQNRESAVRSRMRKKHYFVGVEDQLIQSQQENNKLKLDNAALRAENQVLRRQLSYFENLFAKK